ncbi:glycosyltransferase [Enterovibrio norvegicus]|uniref:glycosyltransferase n=1 Tax=Enterovibrio norvegicus TaxID=188144 RepID=UPI0013CFA8AD|nr:glycosyltransferase [Enterovibrio norvegicus]
MSTLVAGSQKVAFNIVDILKESGKNVTCICRSKNSDVKDFYSTYDSFYFPFEDSINLFFGTGNLNLKDMNYKKIPIFLFLVLALNLYVIYKAVRSKSKTIYCYDPKGIIVSGLLSKILGFKVIWHLHGELRLPTALNRVLCRLACDIIVPSKYVQRSIESYSKSTVIYNGFDFDKSFTRRKFDTNRPIKLLYIGTLVPHKGLHSIFSALKNTCGCNHKYELDIVGDGVGNIGEKYVSFLKDDSANLPKEVKVNFIGWVKNPDKYIIDADVLLFSSISEGSLSLFGKEVEFRASEALPTVLIEALSFGTPVIANDIAGVAEIVTDDTEGFIISDFSKVNLYSLIDKVLKNCNVDYSKTRSRFCYKTMGGEFLRLFTDRKL